MGIEHLLGPLFLFNPTCSFSSRSLLRGGDLEGGGSSREGRGRLQWGGEGVALGGGGEGWSVRGKRGQPPRAFVGEKKRRLR
jgi:hypothetical protein